MMPTIAPTLEALPPPVSPAVAGGQVHVVALQLALALRHVGQQPVVPPPVQL